MGAASRITFEGAKLAARQLRAHHDFHRALAGCSPGSHLIELPGIEALVVPACPWFSVVNCVFSYESADALEDAVPKLDEEYAHAGASSYRIWVPAENQETAVLLADSGFGCYGTFLRMASNLAGQDLEPRKPLDLLPEPSWETIARCNDRAYGLPAGWTIASAFSSLDHPAFHLYAARSGGAVVSVLATHEEARNCYICFMATVLDAQRTGIGAELVQFAKRAARDRGCEVASGESTLVGKRLYTKTGARVLGQLQAWDRSLGASPSG